jgi:phosphoglycerate dehydrogenase-like enzyme
VNSIRRHCGSAALLLLSLAAAQATSAAESGGDAAAMIAQYGLREASEPVSVRQGWRRPSRVVVDASVPGLTEALRQRFASASPSVEFIAVGSSGDMAGALQGAEVAIGRNGFVCDDRLLAAGRELRWLQTLSSGVELCAGRRALAERDILLTNMRAISGPVIAEHAIAMLLALSRGLHVSVTRQVSEDWNEDFPGTRLTTLSGKTLLVVGLGGIGGDIAKRAHALGMRVIATRATRQAKPDYVDYVGLPDELAALIPQADAVVNAAPLTPATRGLFDAQLFAKMKRTAYFINVARGQAVVTADLVAALGSGQIAGAGLDVTEPEPLPRGHPLWRAPNLLLTPHMSGSSTDGGVPQLAVVIENLRRYLAGERMLSVVDIDRGY